LSYSGGGKAWYPQRSSLTISWTDTLSRDPCINLYLVQDKGEGLHYVTQVVNKCLQPAASGAYTWTIPGKYSGSGFRIYGGAPGGMSSAVGPAFNIVQAEPESEGKK
jgi:hypothetical protein